MTAVQMPPRIASLIADLVGELFAAGGNEAAVIEVLRENRDEYGAERFGDLLLLAVTVLFAEHVTPDPSTTTITENQETR